MRGSLALYLIALGWYIRWSGLDTEVAEAAGKSWRQLVRHTDRLVREGRAEAEDAAYRRLLSDDNQEAAP